MSPRAEVLGCAIDRLDLSGTLDAVEQVIASRRFTQHMSVNAAKLVTMHDDPRMRDTDESGRLQVAEQGVVLYPGHSPDHVRLAMPSAAVTSSRASHDLPDAAGRQTVPRRQGTHEQGAAAPVAATARQ